MSNRKHRTRRLRRLEYEMASLAPRLIHVAQVVERVAATAKDLHGRLVVLEEALEEAPRDCPAHPTDDDGFVRAVMHATVIGAQVEREACAQVCLALTGGYAVGGAEAARLIRARETQPEAGAT